MGTDTAAPRTDGGRQARRRARTRARLLEAARGLVAERGFDGITMSDVTAAADLGAGTVYNYFPTLTDLTAHLVHEEIDTFGDRLDLIAGQIDDPAEVYAASLRLLVRHAIGDPLWGRFYVRLGVGHPTVRGILGPRCHRDLQNGIDAGVLRIDDLDVAVASTFGALAAVLDLISTQEDPGGIDQRYAEAMLRMVGVPFERAQEIVERPLPELPEAPHGV